MTSITRSATRILQGWRGGTISHIGVYGMADPLPLLALFDKQIQLRMGRANVTKGSTTLCRCSPTMHRTLTTSFRKGGRRRQDHSQALNHGFR